MGNKYTNEELIELYKKFALKLGRTPLQKDINEERKTDKTLPSSPVLSRRFGGLTNLNNLCGLEMHYKYYTDEEMLVLLYDFYLIHGFPTKKMISMDNSMPHAEVYCNKFGSFKEAIIRAKIPIPKHKEGRLNDNFCELTEEQLLDQLEIVIKEYGIIQTHKFKEYGLKSFRVYRNRFNTYKNILEILNVEINEDIMSKYFSKFKNITKEDLLIYLRNFYNKFGIPTTRMLKFNKDMPSDSLYRERFGSFQNALVEAGICIPESREWLYDRKSVDNETILEIVSKYIHNNFTEKDRLPTLKDLYTLCNAPSYSVLNNRFNTTENFYNQLGIDYFEHNKKAFEFDMIDNYIKLKENLGYVPDSRDVDIASKQGLCQGMKTYSEHFGSLIEFQKSLGYEPTANLGLMISKEEALMELKELGINLGRLPTQKDTNECEWTPSQGYYHHNFGSYGKALILAGFDSTWYNRKVMITPKGNLAFSSYEYDFTTMLEERDVEFTKEDYYKNHIKGFTERLQFDHILYINGNTYYVEIFGIMEYEWYRNKTIRKIKLCEDNDLILIDLYKEDFKKKNRDQLYEMLMERIKEIDNKIILKEVN